MKTQSNFYLFLIALISSMGGFPFGLILGGGRGGKNFFYTLFCWVAWAPLVWGMGEVGVGCLFGGLGGGVAV